MTAGKWADRAARLEMVAAMRMHTGRDGHPPWHVTARQAARRLGVSMRTIERYKRELREQGSAGQRRAAS